MVKLIGWVGIRPLKPSLKFFFAYAYLRPKIDIIVNTSDRYVWYSSIYDSSYQCYIVMGGLSRRRKANPIREYIRG